MAAFFLFMGAKAMALLVRDRGEHEQKNGSICHVRKWRSPTDGRGRFPRQIAVDGIQRERMKLKVRNNNL
jgi:hypothetical protein